MPKTKKITLRDYQQGAVDAVYIHLRDRDDNPCVVIPTAGGKTPIMATICRDVVTRWGGRVLVLAHVKELVAQTSRHLTEMAPDLMYGINSAGLGSRDRDHQVIVAGIQSVYRDISMLGPFDIILIDEAHLIPPDGEGMYRTLLADMKVINPSCRIVGLTATPYRMKGGMICSPENILNHICFEKGVRELIEEGYISRPVSKEGTHLSIAKTEDLHIRGGEFIDSEVQEIMDTDTMVRNACADIIHKSQDRESVLIFCSGIDHARHVQKVLLERFVSPRKGETANVQTVFGDDLPGIRDETIQAFKNGKFKYLINVGVLTHGFDHPPLDCIVLLRCTASPGLYYQMVGRGFRLYEGKENFLVLDYGENVIRHGPVDAVVAPHNRPADGEPGESPTKKCPECECLIACGCLTCPECGFLFPEREVQHDHVASDEPILQETKTTEHECEYVTYQLWERKLRANEDPLTAPIPKPTMRVQYMIKGLRWPVSEWICFEHEGYARTKAEDWWMARSNEPIPDTVRDAVNLAIDGAVAEATLVYVTTTRGQKYPEISGYTFGPKPESFKKSDDKLWPEGLSEPGDKKITDNQGFDWATGEQVT